MIKLFLPLLFVSCLTTQVYKLDPAIYYKHDLCFEFSGREYCEPTVLPLKNGYDYKFKGEGRINFFSFTTCSREIGIDENRRKHKVNYVPDLEKNESNCPSHVAAYSKKGKHSWNFIAYEQEEFKLKATIHCNGDVVNANGVSVCQSRENLIQKIIFENETLISEGVNGNTDRKEPCPKFSSVDKKSYEFLMPPRECVYYFIDKKTKAEHILFTIGYEEMAVRE